MKTVGALLAAIALFLVACGNEDSCSAGDMRCKDNVAQMCNSKDEWEAFQNCGSLQQACSTEPADCSGYSNLACCH